MPGRRQQWLESLRQTFSDQHGFLAPLVHVDEQVEGAAQATRQAIVSAVQQAPGSPVLLLEDDVAADATAVQAVPQARFTDSVAVISFCDMREVEEYAPDGLYNCSALGSDGRGWWGNQALLIHPDTAQALAAADWFSPAIEQAIGLVAHRAAYNDGGRNCADIRLALIVHAQARRNCYAVHVPSLFLHLGHDSLCFPGRGMGERATRNWIGHRRHYGIR